MVKHWLLWLSFIHCPSMTRLFFGCGVFNVSTGCLAILSTLWISSIITLLMDNKRAFSELSRRIFIFLYLNVECNSQEGNVGHVWRGQRGAGGGCRLVFCYEFISKSNTIPVLYSAAARHSNNFTRTSTSTTTSTYPSQYDPLCGRGPWCGCLFYSVWLLGSTHSRGEDGVFKCFPFLFLGGNNASSLWASLQPTTVHNTINGYRCKDIIDKAHIVNRTLLCCHWFYLMSCAAKYLKVIHTPYLPCNIYYIPSLWFDSLSRIIAANLREI